MSKEERSHRMSRIRSKETKPEIRLRKALWVKGLRYRKYYDLPGKPDIVFPGKKIAVFCDGCFWHGCPKHYRKAKSRRKYWIPKIEKNIERDRKLDIELANLGWKVIRVWECEIEKNIGAVAGEIEEACCQA